MGRFSGTVQQEDLTRQPHRGLNLNRCCNALVSFLKVYFYSSRSTPYHQEIQPVLCFCFLFFEVQKKKKFDINHNRTLPKFLKYRFYFVTKCNGKR